MSQDNLLKLKCSNCGNINYWTNKNKKTVERKLEFSKFCRNCRKYQKHQESKKK